MLSLLPPFRFSGLTVLAGLCLGAAAPLPPPTQADLDGQWRIVTIDGRRPLASGSVPTLTIDGETWQTASGCNRGGGSGLVARGRWYTLPGPWTERGCGEIKAQETKVQAVINGGPQIVRMGHRLRLVTPSHQLLIERTGAVVREPWRRKRAPQPLALGFYRIATINGRWTNGAARVAEVRADEIVVSGGCGLMHRKWRDAGPGRLQTLAGGSSRRGDCPAETLAEDQRIERSFGPDVHFVSTGPQGWLLLVNPLGSWLAFSRMTPADEAAAIRARARH